jgi:hydroxymethylpyrimidine pyrophosphatase-like HAD family hydrolase
MCAVKGLRVVFDLDNTLVTYPTIPGDYNSVNPIAHTIALAKQLKQQGAYIIIHTARRMGTHNHKSVFFLSLHFFFFFFVFLYI